MRFEQQVGSNRSVDLVGRQLGKAGLRVIADVSVGPAIEAAPLYPDQQVRWQIVAEPIALLHDGPKVTGIRMEGQGGRIACAGGIDRLVRTVRVEALDCGFRLRLDAEIAGRANTDEQRTVLRIDCQRSVLVTLRNAEDAFLGDQLRAVGAGHRLALVGWQLVGALRRDWLFRAPGAAATCAPP